eukprot:scaffold85_cov175-Ochromonas_danica.AAC.15
MSPSEILLTPLDYPETFRGRQPGTKLYAHPTDYQTDSQPIIPELFLYKEGARTRFFLRTSFKLLNGNYTAATFLVDSGITSQATGSDIGSDYITTTIGDIKANCSVEYNKMTPKPANIIGFPMLLLLGLRFNQSRLEGLIYDTENVAREVCTFSTPFEHL